MAGDKQLVKNDGIKLIGFLTGFGVGFGGAVGVAGGMSNFLGLFTPFGWLAASAVATVFLVGAATASDFADCLDDALKEMSRRNTTFDAAYRTNVARESRPPVDALSAAFEGDVASDSKIRGYSANP